MNREECKFVEGLESKSDHEVVSMLHELIGDFKQTVFRLAHVVCEIERRNMGEKVAFLGRDMLAALRGVVAGTTTAEVVARFAFDACLQSVIKKPVEQQEEFLHMKASEVKRACMNNPPHRRGIPGSNPIAGADTEPVSTEEAIQHVLEYVENAEDPEAVRRGVLLAWGVGTNGKKGRKAMAV